MAHPSHATEGPSSALKSSTASAATISANADPIFTAQCDALIASGLQDQILLPGDAAYDSRINSWWSASSRLRPWCIVQPRSAEDVSKAVKALSKLGKGGFAVRSGGHSHWAGGSNVDNGVTIDLMHLNNTTYVEGSKFASIGPAQNWANVFRALEAKGVMVAGGRDAGVGVGGFVTGGGNSFYTNLQGFACDSLVGAEVVLADGQIVNANANEHKDLWKALKGGSGNFGIVTRFDMEVFDAGLIWGGIRASDRSHIPELIDELISITDKNVNEPTAVFIMNFTYQPAMFPDVIVAQVLVDVKGNENPSLFDSIQRVPKLFQDIQMRPMSKIAVDYELPHSKRNVWYTFTFKNDARVVQKAADLHDALVADLLKIIPAKEFVTQSLFQPVPRFVVDRGIEKGGNVLGLDNVPGNSLLWLSAVAVDAVEFEPVAHQKANAAAAELKAYAESIDALVPWQYINYADPSQNPLKSYGAANLKLMREVSQKYDPTGFFQSSPSGFKLSRVD